MSRVPVYVAGASRNWQRSRDFAQRLQETGKVEITAAWWAAVEKHGVGNDTALTDEQRSEYAGMDLMAVDAAAIMLVLWDEHRSEGRAVELGWALSQGNLHVVAAGPGTRRCIFLSLVDICFDADEAEADELAFDAVMSLVEARTPDELAAVVAGQGVP